MIRLLDTLLRDALANLPPDITSVNQIRFQAPDEDMRNFVRNSLKRPALDVFLADVRDNRKLRTNDVARRVQNGDVFAEPPPDRIDCHYLITAWRPELPGPASDPTPDEHHLLFSAVAALLRLGPLNPARFYGQGSAKAMAWPEGARASDLPTTVLTVEGFQRFSELWHGMGTGARWKPALHLIVTLPVLRDEIPDGPMVTTQVTRYYIKDVSSSVEYRIIIGGQVTHPVLGKPAPVPGAWVRLEVSGGGALLWDTTTDANGRFLLEWQLAQWPAPTPYRLHFGAEGIGEGNRDVFVPSETGEYNLLLP